MIYVYIPYSKMFVYEPPPRFQRKQKRSHSVLLTGLKPLSSVNRFLLCQDHSSGLPNDLILLNSVESHFMKPFTTSLFSRAEHCSL